MDYSKHETNKSYANSSSEDVQKEKRKSKHRSEKQVERCRKYRERQSTAIQNNATREVDKYIYGQHAIVYPRVPVPPFQFTCLSIPGATPMHQPFYFFSPGVIPPAHIPENMVLSASIPQGEGIQSNSASAKYQENSSIFHPVGSTSTNDGNGQDNQNKKYEEVGNHDNNTNDDDTSLDDSALSSKDNDDNDMVGIMSIFANSSLHCVLNTVNTLNILSMCHYLKKWIFLVI